jgi:hypothetical protein
MKPRTLAALLESVRYLIDTSEVHQHRPCVTPAAYDELEQAYKQIMQEAADGIR